ncbi:glycine betaine ABC transporter substrate-binding protein [Paracerasibacillus soli]|uniref:Glycine betaine ABC transporter substrate-binding protein n=1 Tax=Paracerasibacillus soli TaxID=480284 RepID=A0ABU5CVG3_9BACI|nr:glycine betaine ABC transporter substrate-binding protein [Virgibacillus soli]MDY0410376.1 glycine betaine ABC transporter substrate-binding protein [Virgibacillus soli]
MPKFRMISITLILFLSLLLVGCANDEKDSDKSEENLGEVLEYTITGIEPGAGLTQLAKDTLEEYDNLKGWKLEESSTAGMTTLLGEAIDNEEPIVITGWSPHWMFAAYDLKFLEDPKGTLGEIEGIHTIVRKDLEKDMPHAYKILDAFQWEVEDMEAVMLMNKIVLLMKLPKSG